MSGRPTQPHEQQHQRQSRHRGSSSSQTNAPLTGTAVPSIETSNLPEHNVRSANPITQSPAQPIFRVPQPPRSAIGDTQTKAAKVAIPRLKRSIDAASETSTRTGGRHRVNHACEPCRHRKTKCSGERPVCRHCQDFKIVCFYADGKRDRVKKQFGSMAEKLADYEILLKELMPKVSEEDAKLIKSSLDRAAQTEVDDTMTDTGTAPSIELDGEPEASGAESEASGGAGSTGALDRTDEDFTREGAKATGFIGKNSDITWLQRLKQENRFGDPPSKRADQETLRMHNISAASLQSKSHSGDTSLRLPEAIDGFTIHDSSYHLDDLPIGTLDTVDPHEIPPKETAQMLFKTYMQRIHPTFPVVGQVNLSAQFQKFISKPFQKPPDKWLAIVNMMFAISAKYSHLIQADWKGDERDYMIYFSRARLLAFDQDAMFNHPDLQLIQILGLMSFYMMSISQINRAWTLTGIAVRYATGLGLSMRNDSAELKNSLKEIRYRLWWSLFTLEHRLCSITGRVNCINDEHCTTPLPAPVDEEKFDTEEGRNLLSAESQQGDRAPSSNSQSPSAGSSAVSQERDRSAGKSDQSQSPSTLHAPNIDLQWAKDAQPSSSLYFLHLVQLSRLTQSVFNRLYNPASIEKTWSYIQLQIKQLNEQLDNWYRRLPSMLDFRRKQRDREFYEFRLHLGFFYYGTKMMANRPCLCRLDRKIPGQSNKSREFNRNAATTCVEAAQGMLRLIPDEPNAVGLLRVGPWWSILSYLVQSVTVLMLEISFRAHHMPEETDSILDSSKKGIRWLHALGEENLSAKRAWELCNSMLHQAVIKIGRDVKDLPTYPPSGHGESSEGATVMSGVSTSQNHTVPQYQPMNMGTPLFEAASSTSGYQGYPSFDSMMRYDQYFPMHDAMNAPLSNLQNPQFTTNHPTDDEVEFMVGNYHDDRGEHQGGMGESGPSGSGPRYMA